MHSDYQAAKYSTVIRELPLLLQFADAALTSAPADDREAALSYVDV